jgi:DNA-directed RNA polymerase subunit RPC12/RpoP
LEQFCITHSLTFRRHSCPKYEYEGLIRRFSPGSGDCVVGATDDGEPYAKLSELMGFREHGFSLGDVIKELQKYVDDVPPFELVEEPHDSANSTSGSYEWRCPHCHALNEEPRLAPSVTCHKCRRKFLAAEFFRRPK